MTLQFALNRLFVVTANLGSVFENSTIEDNWLAEFEKVVIQADPDLVALHCQEVGGKDFEICMPKVKDFIKKLREMNCFSHFDRVRGWFDTEFQDSDGFTALGSLYLFHKRVETVHLWNFRSRSFNQISGDEICFDTLSSDHDHCKEKFPNEYFPEVKWSRKGYIHTRWRMFGSRLLNFVNIHLFHDDDNLIALEKTPSIYTSYRRKALQHTLRGVSTNLGGVQEPIYIHGDFNFRLNTASVLRHLMDAHKAQMKKQDDGVIRLVCSGAEDSSSAETLLTVEKKRFTTTNGAQFTENYKELLEFDVELKEFKELKELPVDFQPSYPFSEKEEEGAKYMDKRCPSWCDRILMNEPGLRLVVESPLGCMYNMMAKSLCVGDHKPIYLFFTVASTTPMKQLPAKENSDA